MPARAIPLITNQVYHIYNKTQGNEPLFIHTSYVKLVRDALWYYQFTELPMKLSYFRHLSSQNRASLVVDLNVHDRLVSILSYCFMPNHYHILLRQESDGGISTYMSKLQNSLTRYINIKRKTKGHIFIGQYKAVRVETDELLLHISRYIHLNPYTGYIVKTLADAFIYPWSSCAEYVSDTSGFCEHSTILSHFKTNKDYTKFMEDQKEYQRILADIKYSLFE